MKDRTPISGATLVGGAVGLVLGCAVLFGALGMLRSGDDVAIDDPMDVASGETGTESEGQDDASEPAATDEATDAPTDEPTEDASPTPVVTAEPSPAASPEPTPEATVAPPASEVDPGSVTIQVLDALGGEDTSAAEAVADELRAQGFNVVVINRAGRTYEVTTVFWSAGREDAGRAVAVALGATQAEQTPAEVQLSDSVAVHVVVGADRG